MTWVNKYNENVVERVVDGYVPIDGADTSFKN